MNARRIGMFLIFAAVAIATVLLATGCEARRQVDAPAREPKPADVLRKFRVGEVTVAEFRDSAGRSCVLAGTVSGDGRGGRAVALDCGPAPVLRYENLPDSGPE